MKPSVESPTTTDTESVIVEAPTVEAALEAVATQIGTDCQILNVEKVSRGGIAGFFGKETFQVEVRRDPVATPGPSPRGDGPGREAIDRVLEAAAAAGTVDDGSDVTFGDVLRAQLAARTGGTPQPSHNEFTGLDLAGIERGEVTAPGLGTPVQDTEALARLREAIGQRRDDPTVEPAPDRAEVEQSVAAPTGPEPDGVVPEPTIPEPPAATPAPAPLPLPVQIHGSSPLPMQGPATPERRSRMIDPRGREPGEPIFTADHLVRTGLPFSFVTQLGDLDGLDDVSRLVQLASAFQPWCGTLPTQDSLVVGLRADRLARILQVPVHGPSDPLPHEGSAIWICDPNDPSTAAYLQQVRGPRSLHVVDPSVDTLGMLDPGTIVSWSDRHTGYEALLTALERGLHLGFDVSGPAPRRATALEMAIDVRSRLPLAGS